MCIWLLMRVCECMCRGDDEVSDEEAGNNLLLEGPCNVT